MTLEEYEKVLEEKRKALLAVKSEERKVNLDKELESMQLLSNKKNDDEVFIRLVSVIVVNSIFNFSYARSVLEVFWLAEIVIIGQGSEKDKRKEAAEKAKKVCVCLTVPVATS